ncbi:hypothetical protein [Undibacterium fentianense]|uniref:Uncharacterized protein n=1 Tax=Undibacterium fentianense TaxID=2828728 RepID=A0A941IGF8_9BURK|nr:hypothetical protein [Undibacterium fentianense]MBR7801332.1 hypothetical protein [Undibacterium fentianense]
MKSNSSNAAPEINDVNQTNEAPAKKSAVLGLPAPGSIKAGFSGVVGQPSYKAKSSKATGAKYRVRQ